MGVKTTYYLYDLESRLLAEIAGNGRVLREYVWLGQEPLALREYELRPGLYYYINDHLGTPQRLITGEGTVVWQSAALPFGRTQVQLGTVQNNLRFPGQYFDAETGLHYNWHRYYDPDTGRYLSPDPIGLDGGLNLYAYVGNDPVNWIDPEGLYAGATTLIVIPEPSTTAAGTVMLLAAVATIPGDTGPDGKFEEKWRRDKGRPEIKRGHGSQDHIHVNGRWYPIKKK